ncbi:MAG: hypothetical protein P8015_18265 [Acidihalobacter sp.]
MKWRCRGEAAEWLDDDTRQVWLHPVYEPVPNYAAGQYLKVALAGLGITYFSIATPPGRGLLELHVDTRSYKARKLMELAEFRKEIEVELPLGKCFLNGVPEHSLLLVAGGTGVSQCLALLSYLAEQDFQHEAALLWSASEDYLVSCDSALAQLQRKMNLIVRLLPRQEGINPNNWLEARLNEVHALHAPKQTFVSGSKLLLDEVLVHVPEEAQVFSDHFSEGRLRAPRAPPLPLIV